MDKEAFLKQLESRLQGLPRDELEERLAFYSEMIDGRISGGAAEEDAVAALGPVEPIVAQITAEIPLSRLMRGKAKREKRLNGGRIALLVLGAPLWLPLLIAGAAVALSLYAVVWAAVLCLWIADVSLGAAFVACLISTAPYLQAGNLSGAALAAGAGLACLGMAILLFFLCAGLTRAVLWGSGRALTRLKTAFIGRGNHP